MPQKNYRPPIAAVQHWAEASFALLLAHRQVIRVARDRLPALHLLNQGLLRTNWALWASLTMPALAVPS